MKTAQDNIDEGKCPHCGKDITSGQAAAILGKKSAKKRGKDYYKDLANKRWYPLNKEKNNNDK